MAASRPPKRRWLRVLRWMAIAAGLLALLLLIGWASLRSRAVRRAILARVSDYAERELGVAVSAEDFTAGWRRGRFAFSTVEVGAPGQLPLATAERIRVDVDLRSLFGNAPVLRSVELIRPRIDLAAPLPTLRQRPASTGGGGLTVERFQVVDAEVVGPPPEGALAQWLTTWSTRGISVAGSYRGKTLEANLESASAVVARPGFAPLDLSAEGQIRWKDGEPLRFSAVEVHGEGVSLAASGHVGLSGSPLAVDFTAEVAPYLLVAETPQGGTLRASGRVALPEESGNIVLVAQDVPAEVLRRLLDAETFADLSFAGTVFDAQAEADLGPGSLLAVAGSADVAWRRHGQAMARSHVDVAATAEAVRLTVDGSLLPRSPGRRDVAATVTAASWAELPAGQIATGRIALRVPELPAAYAEVRSLWPRWVPEVPQGAPLQGELTADARLSGSLRSPHTALDAQWVPAVGSAAHLTATGKPLALSGSASLALENVSLELARAFVPDVAGTVSGTIDLATTGRDYTASAALDASNLSHPQASVRTASLSADGLLRLQPLRFTGTASGLAHGFELAGTACGDRLDVFAAGELAAEIDEIAGMAFLSADRLVLADLDEDVRGLTVEVATAADRIHLTRLRATLPAGRTVDLSGEVSREPFLAEASFRATLESFSSVVERAELTATLVDGVVTLDAPSMATATGPVQLAATVPLGALDAVPRIAEAIAGLPLRRAPGPVAVSFAVPALDSQPLLAALGRSERPERVTGSVQGKLTFDPGAPAKGQGEVVLEGLRASTADGSVEVIGPLALRLDGGKLDLKPVRLRLAGAGLAPTEVEAQGAAQLRPTWNPFEDPAEALLGDLSARVEGTVEASLLNPYLQGGAAEGPLSLSADAHGTLDRLDASVRLSGPQAAFVWPSPYVTRVAAPEAVLTLRGGRLVIEKGQASVNGGTVSLAGGRESDGTVDLEADFSGLRYRVDYGLATQLGGRLRFTMPPAGRSRLAGRLSIDRGVLDRDINLDREVLDYLLAPAATPGTEAGFLDTVDLAISVATEDGVRIRNNVADLRASWEPLEVSGTLAVPVIRGRIDLDPEGLFHAYGQTLRIDRGALVFTGNPLADPQLDMAVTSSLENPSIGTLRGVDPDLLAVFVAEEREEEKGEEDQGPDLRETVTSGLTSYYGTRLLSALGESLGVGGFSVRPILVFNEVDPSARLTVGKDLSQTLSVAVSLDLRSAVERLYLLELHSLPRLPRLSVQGFTGEEGSRGASLQQVVELGGARERGSAGPRLGRLTFEAPSGHSRRRLARAAGLHRGSPVPSAFQVEVDVAGYLRRRGYPDPEVTMTARPSAAQPTRLDVVVQIAPGPHVEFAFAGDRPPRSAREAITDLYRTDFYEPTSRAEMETAAVRAFRRVGHLDPEVEIEVHHHDSGGLGDPAGSRTVTLRSTAGARVRIREMTVAGLSEEDSAAVAARFPGTLARVELAAGVADADRRLLDTLRTLGWPEARVLGHGIGDRGRRLVVSVEPGPRQHLGRVEIAGARPEVQDFLTRLVAVARGEPARYARVSQIASAMEADLRERGFAEAAVHPLLAVSADGRLVDLTFEVSAGPRFELSQVGFEGERWSRERVLARTAGLAAGDPFSSTLVGRARSRLFGFGAFSRVTAETVRDPETGEARVTFSLSEKPRFRLAYGLHWSSDTGTAAVVDFVDQNFLGRGLTFGVRGLYKPDDSSGRLYFSARELWGSRYSFESFLLVRRQFPEEGFVEDTQEAALQLARPLGSQLDGRLYLRYRRSRFFEEEPDPFFPIDLEITNPYVGTLVIYDARDDPIDPRRGLLASADLAVTGPWLGGDFDYARLFAQVAAHRDLALGGRPFGWAGSVRVGLARAFGGQELLRQERFFAGGELTVRGYPFEGLGPQEVLGDFVRPLGGESLLVVNQELRVALPFDLTGLVFFDAGQVWSEAADFGSGLAKSLGLGLRAWTPLGLVRFDAGFPLDRRPGDDRYRLYLGLGNAF